MNKTTSFAGFGLPSFLLFVFFFFCQSGNAAIPDFTLSVTKTNETCTGNGSLTFNVSGTDPGATVAYSVYLLPNTTTPIATLSGNTLGGLSAGTYRIVATQTLGSESNSKQQDVVILDNVIPLTYQIAGQYTICGDDGRITVLVSQGTAVSYEIISGPVIRPLQASNVFDLLPAGDYQVRVFDNCGEGVVQNYTVIGYTANFIINPVSSPDPDLPTCNTIVVPNSLTVPNGNIIAYPLTVEYTVFPPAGSPVLINLTIPGGAPFSGSLGAEIPFFNGQTYSYNVKVTDACGNVYNSNGNIVNEEFTATISAPPVGCNDKKLVIGASYFVGPVTVNFLAAPAGFDPTTYNMAHPGPFEPSVTYWNPAVQLLPGIYTVQVTDSCGRTATATTNVTFDSPPASVAAFIMMGCEPGQGAVSLISVGTQLVTVKITNAPAGYPNPLPDDVSFNIYDGSFSMNSLPTGSYTFQTVDSCNNLRNTNVMVLPYNILSNDISVVPACNSFGLDMNYDDTAIQSQYFWLQKLNAAGQWGHPETGVSIGTLPTTANALPITNGIVNPNLMFTGEFRVLVSFQVYGNGTSTMVDCFRELYNFEYSGGPEITAVTAFSCSADSSDVVVTATGIGPLIYRITTKDGDPFAVNNANDSLFTGLEPAVYNFQVEDACGNILNRIFDVTTPIALSITPSGLCEGQPGSLTIPLLPFLTYEWYKGTDTATILSTSNVLAFPAFNSAADAGMYHVYIMYPNLNSCINQVLDFEISPNLANPEAGTGTAVNYCGTQGSIDLFGLLTGTFDTFGTWTEMEGTSGALSGNVFNSDAAGPGIYTFKYTVEGLCDFVDETTVDISIHAIPATPAAFLEQEMCSSQPLLLLATTIPNVTYSWTGPNGFTSSEQNPIIANPSPADNGTYSVKVLANGCESGTSSIDVTILPSPQFVVTAACEGNDFVLHATPAEGAIVPETTTYSWTGPDGYNALGGDQVITGWPGGIYEVSVSSPDSCPFTGQVAVEGTLCGIPKGVSPNEDGDNDDWDLSGFDIETVQIFNRYGMEVYEKAHYINEWHGQDKRGHMLPTATYYYLVKLASGEAKSGWVYLLRRQ